MAGGREPHGADLEPLTRASVPHDSDQLRLQPERSLMGEQQPVSSRSASKRQVPCLLHAVKKTWSGHLLCWAHPALCLASRRCRIRLWALRTGPVPPDQHAQPAKFTDKLPPADSMG